MSVTVWKGFLMSVADLFIKQRRCKCGSMVTKVGSVYFCDGCTRMVMEVSSDKVNSKTTRMYSRGEKWVTIPD